METTYCDKCGLLHDPSDGECLGCGMVSEIKQKDQRIKELEEKLEIEMVERIKLEEKIIEFCGQCGGADCKGCKLSPL